MFNSERMMRGAGISSWRQDDSALNELLAEVLYLQRESGVFCRVPVAVGAVWPSSRKLGLGLQQLSHASAESTSQQANGETRNNMRWLSSSGSCLDVLGLVAKPLPQQRRRPPSNICYEVEWQARLAATVLLIIPGELGWR